MRLTTLVPAFAAVALAACGGSATSNTASKPTPTPAAARAGAAAGKLTTLSGTRLVLSGQTSSVVVTYTSTTRFAQSVAGAMSDIAAGACVTAVGQNGAGGITATSVAIQQDLNGNCTQNGGGNGGAGRANGRPGGGFGGGGGGAGAPGGPGGNPNFAAARGQVASVSGTTVTVQPASGGSPTTVTVPATARITKTEAVTSSQLALGQCIQASGQRNSAGTLTARTLTIVPAGPNGCVFGSGGNRAGAGGAGGGASTTSNA